MSIAARITWFAGAVSTALCALLAATVMFAIHRYVTGGLIAELAADGGRLAHQVEHNQIVFPLVEHSDRNVQILNQAGQIIAATSRMRGKPVMATLVPDGQNIIAGTACGGVFPPGECEVVVAQSARRGPEDWTVYIASPAIPWYVAPWLATTVIGAIGLLALALTALGHRIVTSSLRPVSAIRAELDEITEMFPGRRVGLPPSHDEIHDLAESVNQTLARLQAAMHQQRRFTSDASHELRTPIAAIRAEVEDALYAPEESSVSRLGASVLPSLDRLEAIVGDLLTIARQEDRDEAETEPVDLAELVASVTEERDGAGKVFDSSLEPRIVVTGNRRQLTRLLSNLLDNAERYAATTITVRLTRSAATKRELRRFPRGVAKLEVVDDGPGIDPDQRELVFQRFARLDTSRGRDSGGTGLGLPIARQIAESHGGTLQVEDQPRGARFVLRLPLP
ncbi:HAMP domain-containing sensor histidine kinase [Nonomuraea antimicrobica]